MTTTSISATCPNCTAAFGQEPQRSFLGFQKLQCPTCQHAFLYPLTDGYRWFYWFMIVVTALLIVQAFATGSFGFPGGLSLAIAYALFKDSRIRAAIKTPPRASIPSKVHTKSPSAPRGVEAIEDPVPVQQSLNADENAVYTSIAHEFETSIADKGLWTKLYVESSGDEKLTKVNYIKHRAATLMAAATLKQQNEMKASQKQGVLDNVKGLLTLFSDGGHLTVHELSTLVSAVEFDKSIAQLRDRVHGNTLLHCCARHGLHGEFSLLVANGADPHALNGHGQTAQQVFETQARQEWS